MPRHPPDMATQQFTTPILEGPANHSLCKLRMEGEFAWEKVSLIISGEDTAAMQLAVETAATSSSTDSAIYGVITTSTSTIYAHITKIRTGNLRLTGMSRGVDNEFQAWILLKALPETAQWRSFVSQTVNLVPTGGKLSLSETEQRVKAEIANPLVKHVQETVLTAAVASSSNYKGKEAGGPSKTCSVHGLCYHETKNCRDDVCAWRTNYKN
ncbi:hypothetical protein C8F01DRAFT_1265939 [Mycena amicta]|nr:hypothetical protein C8F01DRAFT_1265939 [Mycena amicta]